MNSAARNNPVDLASVAAEAALRYELVHKEHNNSLKLRDSRRASLSTHHLSSDNSVHMSNSSISSSSNTYCSNFNERHTKSPSIRQCASIENDWLESRCSATRIRARSTAQEIHLHGAAVEIEVVDRPWRLRRAASSSCSATQQHIYPYVVEKATQSNSSTMNRCDCNTWKDLTAGAQRNRLQMIYGSGRPWERRLHL